MKLIFCLSFFYLFLNHLYSQEAVIQNTRLDQTIQLDGVEDQLWSNCPDASLNYQLEPDQGTAPTRKTSVKVAQYKETLFFIFVCEVASKDEITASIQQRDALNTFDDLVSVILDTYNDNRSGVLLQVNPIGTIADAKLTNDGKSIDYLWDTEWKSATRIYPDKWIAEISIPLSSFQFNPTDTVWGCNFSRSIRYNQEIVWWQNMTENYRVSGSGQLRNLKLSELKDFRLSAFPYGTLRYNQQTSQVDKNPVEGTAGMDIRFNYQSNLRGNIAINPDFASVEGDKTQINLTPFELKFPEKRLFFQDGNELFDTRIQTFYSRRVGDIILGGKANGKIGKYQFNGIYANTKADLGENIQAGQYNAFRMKRDVLKASTVGITYTDKITDSLVYHTFSADYNLNLAKEWKLTGQVVSSAPGDFLSHSAWFMRFAKENNIYHYHVRYTEIGENFAGNVNQTGFITDDNRREVDADVRYKFWFNTLANYLFLSSKNNVYWSKTGTLRSWYLTYGGRLSLKNKLSLDLYYNNEYKNAFRSQSDDFYNHFYRGIIGYNTDENSYASLSYRRGVNFKKDFQLLEFNSSIHVLKKLSLQYELKHLTFHPDPLAETTWLNILGMSYYQTKDLWLRLFTQHDTSHDRLYFYGQAAWRFKPPFGALYLIFTSDRSNITTRPKNRNNIVFLKVSYPINIIG